MIISENIVQQPEPGTHLLRFRGDTLTFKLISPVGDIGSAWLRTNIGRVDIVREEIIRSVHENLPPLGRDWFDIQMIQLSENTFETTLPLREVGHFEAKCFFLSASKPDPCWPPGPNTVINVEPADICCANIIYNAFVRQFGPNKAGGAVESDSLKDKIADLDKIGYTVIPPSGTFRDLILELDFIMGTIGCRIIQLLPIHPTPTTYGRMGRFGSPYAALSFTGVDPALAQFDPHATPLEQFIELVDAIHSRHGKIILDIAINHTGWAAGLHETHPGWLDREPDGRINVPGAWGIQWEDLTKLDYCHKDLWQYMAAVFLTWCRRGVDGFRCDAGYMIPSVTWRYIVAKIREQYPDTIFFLEGLGGKISDTRKILNDSNFDWAYSELFQNYNRQQIEAYLPEAIQISDQDGITVNYAETHDNDRLASKSHRYSRLRVDLCGLLSSYGAFGFANGVEWFAKEKIDVHQANSLNWGAESNQVNEIARLNKILKNHPSFFDQTQLSLVQDGPGNHVAMLRHHHPTGKKLLVLANLDENNNTFCAWKKDVFKLKGTSLVDLISGKIFSITENNGNPSCILGPLQIVCLSQEMNDLTELDAFPNSHIFLVPRIVKQRLRAKVLDIFSVTSAVEDIHRIDLDQCCQNLSNDPESFCKSFNLESPESRVIRWLWPEDVRRTVMVPPDHFLLVLSITPFRSRIICEDQTVAQEESLPLTDGGWFSLFIFNKSTKGIEKYSIITTGYTSEKATHTETPLLLLPQHENASFCRFLMRPDLENKPRMLLLTNNRGAMLRAPVLWGKLQSKYDALLAANLNDEYPVDRTVLFTRCRAWIVFQDYSQEIGFDCFFSFNTDDQRRGVWRFHVPTGQGEHLRLTIRVEMIADENRISITFYRHPSANRKLRLTDELPVNLIIRPDIEYRSFHETTKAYLGPEQFWPRSVKLLKSGFSFAPDAQIPVNFLISNGAFFHEPEWCYMVYRSDDDERGFDPNSDLFSPGYFKSELYGNSSIILTAYAENRLSSFPDTSLSQSAMDAPKLLDIPKTIPPSSVMINALSDYTVVRGTLKSVIAGYPWFLDWGRDSLIFVRGLVASKKFHEAKEILIQFGQFEEKGTLPNMILGGKPANRDTSDAPLWFFVSVADLIQSQTSISFLNETCGNRKIIQILNSIADSYISGTPNGIKMDPSSGLIYSPPHFTWMDTNFPASTPREGFPIEIQALWHFSVSFLARYDSPPKINKWKRLSEQISCSIKNLFYINSDGYLSDCLHCGNSIPAEKAEQDDALRPNQLIAITLGAITDKNLTIRILKACESLLVPGAIRSLADRPLKRPLPILHHGKSLNNPFKPYAGRYIGDEDTQRKPAYHNGTAWTWLFPSFCEAWEIVYGKKSSRTALSFLLSSITLMEEGCFGHLPEIIDGDSPHTARGCDAQAWGSSEWTRVWIKLNENIT